MGMVVGSEHTLPVGSAVRNTVGMDGLDDMGDMSGMGDTHGLGAIGITADDTGTHAVMQSADARNHAIRQPLPVMSPGATPFSERWSRAR